jgi:hypothetical protein
MDRTELTNRQRLMEAIPHVAAWCPKADGVPLPPGLPYPECTPSCDNWRTRTAGQIYSAGFRLPVEFKPTIADMMRPLPTRPTALVPLSRGIESHPRPVDPRATTHGEPSRVD